MKSIFASTLVYLICCFIYQPIFPQSISDDHVPGEVMIQINPDTKLKQNKVINQIENDFSFIQLESIRLLSKRMGVWLLKFDVSKATDNSALESIKKHPAIAQAQFNHYVSQRETIPNDAIFFEQWALKNTGQQGGTPDADIDATDAWDINPGGVTVNGDTVVIAIVDGGCYLNHPDLLLWKNKHEIPNNGIDDDNNGYIDDYDGWNAYTHSGSVYNDSHGTHVCGIAGAKGNNETGVSGVNWHAKILPVCGSSTTESVVVEAYGYVLELRSTYNETNADSGAFVISTNASFGVNYGNPLEFPIWGAMYDSLGLQGVISAGATMNINKDVDKVGDVPTAFDSDYLISVTNTNRFDEKKTGAAYGDTTIDLGAPGTQIMSTRSDGTYIVKTGTSMASPHVAGAVAYLLSAADQEFLNSYKNDPATYCLKLKQYILDGVDILPNFDTLTVSGGRLNLYNSLMIMQNPPEMAFIPTSLNASLHVEEQDSAILKITNSGGHTLNYTINNEDFPEWLTVNKTTGSLETNETDTVKVYFDANSLPVDTYYHDIAILHNYYNHDTVPAELEVLPQTSIREAGLTNDIFKVYPNPFKYILYISISLENTEKIKISLFSSKGQLIENIANENYSKGEYTLELSNELKPGIYYLTVKTKEKNIVKKLIKH